MLPDKRLKIQLFEECSAKCIKGIISKLSGASERAIILHTENENGFFQQDKKCFVGRKNSTDYCNEMRPRHYRSSGLEKFYSLYSKSPPLL